MAFGFAGKEVNKQPDQQAANSGDDYDIGFAQATRDLGYPLIANPGDATNQITKKNGTNTSKYPDKKGCAD
jgi:hypothetical protein